LRTPGRRRRPGPGTRVRGEPTALQVDQIPRDLHVVPACSKPAPVSLLPSPMITRVVRQRFRRRSDGAKMAPHAFAPPVRRAKSGRTVQIWTSARLPALAIDPHPATVARPDSGNSRGECAGRARTGSAVENGKRGTTISQLARIAHLGVGVTDLSETHRYRMPLVQGHGFYDARSGRSPGGPGTLAPGSKQAESRPFCKTRQARPAGNSRHRSKFGRRGSRRHYPT